MEEKVEGLNGSAVTLKSDEAPESYRMEQRNVNPVQVSGSTGPTALAAVMTTATPVSVAVPTSEVKRKRGRPRKYGSDGSVSMALSPMPISASIPLTGDLSSWNHSASRPMESFKKKHKLEYGVNQVAYSVGANFTPHMITVHAGMDVSMKIVSFAQQGSRAICVLAANGSISNVTLQQPNSSGGTLTYEGRFEILSLTGSFMPNDDGITKSRSGGMSISLAGPDGRVLGGGLAGMLVAAGPVQVVVGSFLPGHQLEQKPKKSRYERAASFTAIPANPICQARIEGPYSRSNPQMTSPASFHGDATNNTNFPHRPKILAPENNNISFAGT